MVTDKEGTEVAAWLNSVGIAALVLKYRVPHSREGALQDVQRALSLARARATEWNIDPKRLGVMGFSAGGNLAAKASTRFDERAYPPIDALDGHSCRPDFAVLVYPAYLDKDGRVAPDLNLQAKIPPTLIVHSEDDKNFVTGSKVYHATLDEAKAPHEFLLYATGGHGYRLRSEKDARAWPQAAVEWLREIGMRSAQDSHDGLPAWVKNVGARSAPAAGRTFSAKSYGAVGDGSSNSTKAIQRAIDACAEAGGGSVTLEPGRYVTGALFLKSNVHLRIDAGVTLLGSQDDADYPSLWTRIAGIEMKWPAALINVNDQRNVKISGGGTIDGRGQKWWDRFYTLLKAYEPRGLRWATDYDAERVRLMVIWQSTDVTVENLSLKRWGFWTLQVVYSEHVTVDKVKISDNAGPSTDGVDIDSSRYVLVANCDIDNNDDDICLKAGRDADGLRVNRPTEYVFIRDNIARRGDGVISFGSETSGGIRHVVAYRNRGVGTSEGVRFKSAKTRGGFVEDVLIRDLKLEDVPLPFTFTLDWFPSYSYARIPPGVQDVPPHWRVMTTPVTPPERGLAEFRKITIEDVEVSGAQRIFTASGLPGKPLRDLRFINVRAEGQEAGTIEYARDWVMENVTLTTADGVPVKVTHCVNVPVPPTRTRKR